VIPEAVLNELRNADAPVEVTSWLASIPGWLEVQQAKGVDPSLAALEAGEQEANSLALQIAADLLLIDESKGRQAARRLGLNVTGTLGVMARADDAGLIDLRSAVLRLGQTSFHISPQILLALLERSSSKGKAPETVDGADCVWRIVGPESQFLP
jgi:predicted nucleic acid-binding protein